MFCPHCNQKIPDGSNICPLCYSSLAGVAPNAGADAVPERKGKKSSGKKNAYTKGTRKKRRDRTPMIIAFGLIVLLVVIIALIIRSMFSVGTPAAQRTTVAPMVQSQATPEGGFIVFGATNTPAPQLRVTPVPQIEVTATPAPADDTPVTYSMNTLRKGDQGPEVVTLQQALTELGYLNGAQDGNFGTGTQTAVKAFQKDHGLDADGIAGRMTLEALYANSSVTPIPETTVAPGDIMDLPG